MQKITFTIHTFEDDLFTYNATENMNFDEWINSEYNSNAVFIYSINDESNLIVSIIGDNTFYLTDSNGNYLTSETKIENGTRYILTDVSPNKTTQINFVVEYDDPNTYELTQTTLNAEEGMTWGEWIYSEYNTLNIYSDDGYIHTNLGAYILNGEEYILSSTVITADAIYSTTNFPEGYFDTINFNIKKDLMSSVEYSARKFMTWDEWVQSEFNTEGFKLNSQGTKILTSDNYAILLDGLEVNPTDIIIEDSEYSLSLMADLM